MNRTEKEMLIWREVMGEMAIFEYQDWLNPRIGLSSTEYSEKRITAPVCCPSCFEPIQTSFTRCPKCGFVVELSMLETLRDNSFELAAYAWNYRKRYEEDITKGKIYEGRAATRYALFPPEDWLIYLASIAFAAIIGGLSYDTFKKILSKLSKSFRIRFQKEIPRGIWRQKFYKNLKEYFVGKKDPDSPVCKAYIEGLIKGARLRAQFESSPLFEISLAEIMQSNEQGVNGENTKLEIPDPSHIEPPSEAEIEKHLKEIVEQHKKMNLAIEQLQEYLSELHKNNV